MPQKSCINEIDTTGIATSRLDESALESIDRQHPYSKLHLSEILWGLLRSFFNKDYTAPNWSGWISKMAVEKTNFKKSQIGFLAPILFPITEFSTVRECLAIFMQASKKLNQTYTFVTMDLAAAKIAFDIKFDDAERFSPVIIHILFQIYIPVYVYAQQCAIIPMHTYTHLFLLCLLHLTCGHKVNDY